MLQSIKHDGSPGSLLDGARDGVWLMPPRLLARLGVLGPQVPRLPRLRVLGRRVGVIHTLVSLEEQGGLFLGPGMRLVASQGDAN